ncbi:hypothetical protein QJS10_CPB18g01111 [Acorus calamus]|uniref:Uncharacterized protein n=1 Tax=Acorus calamus TaxID=4465 RepID=A0AAV9CMI4_ACOCL|nr:hypothetical protein QJS10_CPB18g01111 [Acorus calamus]
MKKLMQASLVGDVSTLTGILPDEPLFDQMVCPNVTQTPLHAASLRGHTAFAFEMLRLKPELSRTRNRDALHAAAANNQVEVLAALLKKVPGVAGDVTSEGETALHVAVKNYMIGAETHLIAHCKDISDTTTIPVDHSASCTTMRRWMKKFVPRDWYRMENKGLKEMRRTMMIVDPYLRRHISRRNKPPQAPRSVEP